MIEFDITDSPDQDILGTYVLKKRIISFGTSLKDIIIIEDPSLLSRHFEIVQTGSTAIGKFNCGPGRTYLNSKKVDSIMILKVDDIIKVGMTTIQIKQIIPEPLFKRQDILNEKCSAIFKNNSELTNTLLELNTISSYYKEKLRAEFQ